MSAVNLPRTSASQVTVVLPRSTTVREYVSADELDTLGNPVPVNAPHQFTYDSNGNLLTDTVQGVGGVWVRTYVYTNGHMTGDSGWVKQ